MFKNTPLYICFYLGYKHKIKIEDLPEASSQLDTVQIAETFKHWRSQEAKSKGSWKLFYNGKNFTALRSEKKTLKSLYYLTENLTVFFFLLKFKQKYFFV